MFRRFLNYIKPFLLPTILFLSAIILSTKWTLICDKAECNILLRSILVIIPYLPYLLFTLGILFGFRSHNTGLVLNSFTLFVCYFALLHLAPNLPTITLLIAFFLPIKFIIWSKIKNKFIFGNVGIRYLLILLIEMGFIFFLSNFRDNSGSKFIYEMYVEFPNFSAWLEQVFGYFIDFLTFRLLIDNTMIYISLLVVLGIFIYHYNKSRNVVNAYYFVLLISVFPGIVGYQNQVQMQLFFCVAGIILLISTIESSFYLAYVDELTSLPGRRRFNESMLNLGRKYTIAMIDVDHFKKFNDSYGHKSGDQALRMVAAKLNHNQEFGKTFRYGGEEFTTIFPGKTLEEAVPILEECRQAIEKTLFIIRDKDRKFKSDEYRGKKKIPKSKQVKITVSIGAAEADKELDKPEKVLKAADKILYKAKHLGRNRVQVFNEKKNK
ncbi:MAG: GGDEF domain-containing protein [Candidatus Cloacimonetes bacterium]|nr:GGDEF domain-containing protein [Candidatus Cloacimonadota bacterium]MCF7814931.1 GGDEF domain-containing protein [Candidatus Cloacimonadota bacterium]MCF7868143.1 GGDEF domain-containing protein [Candidatus Cloacimonadota bacterium]MCF7883609.1 GGDEF domain-containing protein [Candidatus Cloacimonadota bacterium]